MEGGRGRAAMDYRYQNPAWEPNRRMTECGRGEKAAFVDESVRGGRF